MFTLRAEGRDATETIHFDAGGYEKDFLKFFVFLDEVHSSDTGFDEYLEKILRDGHLAVETKAANSRAKFTYYPVE